MNRFCYYTISGAREYIMKFSRSFKYLFLLVALLITIRVVFDGFSYYSARRSLDAELNAKQIGSLEYLQVLARKEHDLLNDYLETRCRERNSLGIYHIGNAGFRNFSEDARKAYIDAFKLKNDLVSHIEAQGAGKLDIKAAREAVNQPDFVMTVEAIEKVLKPTSPANAADFSKFMQKPRELGKRYAALFNQHKDIFTSLFINPKYLDVSDINILEAKLARINSDRKTIKGKLSEGWEELLSRYAVWTTALTGVNDLAIDAITDNGEQDSARLAELDCAKPILATKVQAASSSEAKGSKCEECESWGSGIGNFYKARLRSYFGLPPIAQTLFVTLFLGALGALTLNVLRLSRIGWWSLQSDPMWGEVLLSPLLGALAAFGIFLLGSTGLLLTSDLSGGQSGAPALSAYFIGLLGFVSGLLYDEAFGRVRRFGVGLFAEGRLPVSGASVADRSLAEVLKGLNASVVAELVMTFGLGSRLSAEKEFTLIVPADSALEQMTLGEWRKLNSLSTRQKFEAWLQRHHSAVSSTLGDVEKETEKTIKLDDGSVLQITKDGKTWKIGNAKVMNADQVWGTGIIHVVDNEPGS
jgi:hypothetical protein